MVGVVSAAVEQLGETAALVAVAECCPGGDQQLPDGEVDAEFFGDFNYGRGASSARRAARLSRLELGDPFSDSVWAVGRTP